MVEGPPVGFKFHLDVGLPRLPAQMAKRRVIKPGRSEGEMTSGRERKSGLTGHVSNTGRTSRGEC